jgi:hypothetical protein
VLGEGVAEAVVVGERVDVVAGEGVERALESVGVGGDDKDALAEGDGDLVEVKGVLALVPLVVVRVVLGFRFDGLDDPEAGVLVGVLVDTDGVFLLALLEHALDEFDHLGGGVLVIGDEDEVGGVLALGVKPAVEVEGGGDQAPGLLEVVGLEAEFVHRVLEVLLGLLQEARDEVLDLVVAPEVTQARGAHGVGETGPVGDREAEDGGAGEKVGGVEILGGVRAGGAEQHQ